MISCSLMITDYQINLRLFDVKKYHNSHRRKGGLQKTTRWTMLQIKIKRRPQKMTPFHTPLPPVRRCPHLTNPPSPLCGRPHLASYTALWSDSVIAGAVKICCSLISSPPPPSLQTSPSRQSHPELDQHSLSVI